MQNGHEDLFFVFLLACLEIESWKYQVFIKWWSFWMECFQSSPKIDLEPFGVIQDIIRTERSDKDKFASFRDMWNFFISRCTQNYTLSAELCFDRTTHYILSTLTNWSIPAIPTWLVWYGIVSFWRLQYRKQFTQANCILERLEMSQQKLSNLLYYSACNIVADILPILRWCLNYYWKRLYILLLYEKKIWYLFTIPSQ